MARVSDPAPRERTAMGAPDRDRRVPGGRTRRRALHHPPTAPLLARGRAGRTRVRARLDAALPCLRGLKRRAGIRSSCAAGGASGRFPRCGAEERGGGVERGGTLRAHGDLGQERSPQVRARRAGRATSAMRPPCADPVMSPVARDVAITRDGSAAPALDTSPRAFPDGRRRTDDVRRLPPPCERMARGDVLALGVARGDRSDSRTPVDLDPTPRPTQRCLRSCRSSVA